MRFVVLIVLAVLAVWLIRRALKAPGPAGQPADQQALEQQDLVRCARCGVHLPRAEARLAGGRTFCGEEHARLGAGEG